MGMSDPTNDFDGICSETPSEHPVKQEIPESAARLYLNDVAFHNAVNLLRRQLEVVAQVSLPKESIVTIAVAIFAQRQAGERAENEAIALDCDALIDKVDKHMAAPRPTRDRCIRVLAAFSEKIRKRMLPNQVAKVMK